MVVSRRPSVDADLVLLAASDPHEADRYAEALIQAGQFAFIFARDAVSALSYAASTVPTLVIVALDGPDGPRLSREIRDANPERGIRIVLVIDRAEFAAAREAGANSVVLRPAAAVMVAIEAVAALRREERRGLHTADRRHTYRGGRRLTDINLG